MGQYTGSPGRSTYCFAELASTSSIIACHLLDFMVQGKITEADASAVRLDTTASRVFGNVLTCSFSDMRVDRQTDMLVSILCILSGGKVIDHSV